MTFYRLYRLSADNRIISAVDFDGLDDDTAIIEAIRIDHADIIEIWSGTRLVDRVKPNKGEVKNPAIVAERPLNKPEVPR